MNHPIEEFWWVDYLNTLREHGWTVGIHNDYRKDGYLCTFWLLTHTISGRFIKGEGPSDNAVFKFIKANLDAESEYEKEADLESELDTAAVVLNRETAFREVAQICTSLAEGAEVSINDCGPEPQYPEVSGSQHLEYVSSRLQYLEDAEVLLLKARVDTAVKKREESKEYAAKHGPSAFWDGRP